MRRRRALTIVGINALLVAVGVSTPSAPAPAPERRAGYHDSTAGWPAAGVPPAPPPVAAVSPVATVRAAGLATTAPPTATVPAATARAPSERDEITRDRRAGRDSVAAAAPTEPAAVAMTSTTVLSETIVTVVTSTTALSETTAPEVAIVSPEGDELRLTPEQLAAAQGAVRDAQARMARARRGVTAATIARAEAEVRKAESNLKRVPLGGATPQEIAAGEERVRKADEQFQLLSAAKASPEAVAAAEAAVRQAESDVAALLTTPAGPEQIAAAEAVLRDAEARLQGLATPPAPEQLAAAEQRVVMAQQQYEAIAGAASQSKTAAEQALAAVTAEIAQVQAEYSTAFWQHEQAQAGADPLTGEQFKAGDGEGDARKQQFYDALVAADARLRDAEARLQQADAAFRAARQSEIDAAGAARAEIDAAVGARDSLLSGVDPAGRAAVEAEVAGARDHLAWLRQTAASTTAAQARLDQARAALLQLQSGPSAPDLAAAQAEVDAARAALDKLNAAAQEAAAKTQAAQAQAQAELDAAAAELKRAKQGGGSRDGWLWPTFGQITSAFGWRDFQVARWHNGVDIANAKDTPIAAARGGVVTEAGWCSGYGFCVKIKHANGYSTEYGHLAGQPPVRAGDAVAAGTIIGAMGTTYDRDGGGFSTGVHLHFTIRRSGQALDPLQFLP